MKKYLFKTTEINSNKRDDKMILIKTNIRLFKLN